MTLITRISQDIQVPEKQVAAVLDLLDQGATIPFIARYRKEQTGSLDEVAVARIRDLQQALSALDARKTAILKSLSERALLTPALEKAIQSAETLAALEDRYEKFRPKRRTRATAAREQGLAPLADLLLAQSPGTDIQGAARQYVNPEKGVESVDQAVNEDPEIREAVRRVYVKQGMIQSRVKKGQDQAGAKFADYFDWQEPAFKAPSHRILAMLRGAAEGMLTVHVTIDPETAIRTMASFYLKKQPSPCRDQVSDSGCLHPAAEQVPGKRMPPDPEVQRGSSGHPGVCPKSQRPAAGPAPGRETGPGHRSGVQDRMQDCVPGYQSRPVSS
jgi:uncharacterized protein